MRVSLLNAAIVTTPGYLYQVDKITLAEAVSIIDKADAIISAIGHQSTAAVVSILVGKEIPMNRINYQQIPGDIAIIFKLKTRGPEGVILSIEEIEQLGYEFWTIRIVEVV